jgi:5-methylcytosine-specific restriction protein A
MRNPKWTSDELILTLDFYFSKKPNIPSNSSIEIIELSNLLNTLGEKIRVPGNEKYRNPNGVGMKLMNFRYLDPNIDGGLGNVSSGDRKIWEDYSNDLVELKKTSDLIRTYILSDNQEPLLEISDEKDEESKEGRILTRVHRYRERNVKLVKKKKESVIKLKGKLSCECCRFDFKSFYGDRGNGFIECHHNKPVSKLKENDKTHISDLSLLCSNCHRMIHTKKPWLSVSELREILKNQSSG